MKRSKVVLALLGVWALVVIVGVLVPAPEEALVEPGSERNVGMKNEPGPDDWFYVQRAYPSGRINQVARIQARQTAMELHTQSIAPGTWELLGPTNVGGRITDVEFHPTDSSVIFAGTASGGIFKTTNNGNNWTPIFDDAQSLAIGDLAVDPNNGNVIYAGTGEVNPGGGSLAYPGDGIYKSTDGGSTWTHMGLDNTMFISRIVIDPTDSQKVYVAAMGNLFSASAERGVYRSTNGGTSWVHVLDATDLDADQITGAVDLVMNPSDPSVLVAASWERLRTPENHDYGGTGSGIWRTSDGGDNWNLITSGLPSSATQPGRIGLAVTPDDPNVVYAVYCDTIGYYDGLYKSTNGGVTWLSLSGSGLSSVFSSYGWWFGNIRVSPTDADTVFVLGLYMYRSTNGGGSFSSVQGSQHVDHHGMAFDPSNSSRIFAGNDGGVYVSTNGGSFWSKLYDQPTNQFYAVEVDPSDANHVLGGAQDNGTLQTTTGSTNNWSNILGGDGFRVLVDPNNSNIIYAEYQYGAFFKSTNKGAWFDYATSGISGRSNWNTPVVFDPSDSQTLYYGAERLYRSTNGAGSWTAISPDLSNGSGGGSAVYGTITTIAVAPTDQDVIYVGTDDGNVWVTLNGGSNWTFIAGSLPDRWITSVAVAHHDALTAYVTLSGYREDDPLPHVFRTTNGGTSWTAIDSNLPDAPVNDIVIDPNSSQTLYLATDVGTYVSYNLGAQWSSLGSGLPIVVVCDLVYHEATQMLYAATYGRSIHRIEVEPAPVLREQGRLKIGPFFN